MKVIFPIGWIGMFAAFTVAMFLGGVGFTDQNGNSPDPGMKWQFLFATIAGGAFIYWGCIRLKRVSLEGQVLYVSNYRQEIAVPLREISEITENRWINIHPVTIHFHHETEFGESVVFMPKVRWFAFLSSHPIVAELRSLVARAHGTTPEAEPRNSRE
jgi:hypothetical protein